MKYKELRAIVDYLKRNTFLKKIERVNDNLLMAVFDKDTIFFDLNRSKNLIYKREDFLKTKHYNAPFDKMLAKRCNKSKVRFELDENDKILRIHCEQTGSYKRQTSTLQLEFVGRGANAIILDENGNVLEALHHDFHRDLRPGKKLYPLEPPKKLDKTPWQPEDMEAYLHQLYEAERTKRLGVLKTSKLLQLNKQKKRLEELLNSLEKEEELLQKADQEKQKGQLVLANLYAIKPYQKVVKLHDFTGNEVEIALPDEAKTPAHAADLFFARAKKLRQKAQNIHIQRENLQEKLRFLERKARLVQEATRPEEIEILFGKKEAKQSKKDKNYEKYLIDGFTIYVGKNKRGNIELLKKAKASDVWLHLKDLPSAHVIISTGKQNLPTHVLQQAAKLCVDFSVDQRGKYLVDYTQRRNVKMRDGANVNYVNYKTLSVDKL